MKSPNPSDSSKHSDATTTLLRAKGITHRWGGLVALQNVNLELLRGCIHAVIGTNGAGKSTLINILSGEIVPTQGQVDFMGRDITRWSEPMRAQAGLGRSYQRTTIYPVFTVLENCRLAAQALYPKPWAWWQDAKRCSVSVEIAMECVEVVGLSDFVQTQAGALSHGQKRQLEIAMCLATRPHVLLLDEPLAGMGANETDRMLALLNQLRKEHAILLVEHDMDAVFKVSDFITVMVNGVVIASDKPDLIRQNPHVQEAYLGHH